MAVEPAPKATLLPAVAEALVPSATELVAAGDVVEPLPSAMPPSEPAAAWVPLPSPVMALPPMLIPAGVSSVNESPVTLH